MGHMKATTFWDKGRRTSIGNQTKVKRSKEGGFCVTFSFSVLFCDRSFFFLYIFNKPIIFFITKNLVINYN
jgi:hypothetical protein